MTPKEEALDNLARAAHAHSNSDNWYTLESLRYFAMKYVATELRLSDDNPDLARGGSVAAFVETLAENFRSSMAKMPSPPTQITPWGAIAKSPPKFEPILEGEYKLSRDEFLCDVQGGGLTDYDGFGVFATETEKSDQQVYPSDLRTGLIWPVWATFVVWYNK